MGFGLVAGEDALDANGGPAQPDAVSALYLYLVRMVVVLVRENEKSERARVAFRVRRIRLVRSGRPEPEKEADGFFFDQAEPQPPQLDAVLDEESADEFDPMARHRQIRRRPRQRVDEP